MSDRMSTLAPPPVRPQSTMTEVNRAAERRARMRRRRRRAVRRGAIVLVSAGAVTWMLTSMPWLNVSEVSVTGAKAPTKAAVTEIVRDQTLGQNVLWLDVDDLERAIGAVPEVREVDIRRHLAPSSVTVEVTERTPAAVLRRGSVDRYVDREGVVFGPVNPKAKGLIRIEAQAGLTKDDRSAATDILDALPKEVRADIESLALTAGGVTLNLSSGATVIWGSPAESDLKATVLEDLLPLKAETYDVSTPQHPAVRLP